MVIAGFFLDGGIKEEVGHSHFDAMVGKLAGRENPYELFEDAVCRQTPFLRMFERNHVSVLTTDGRGPLPPETMLTKPENEDFPENLQCASDLGGDTVIQGCPSVRNDGDRIASI